jgi:hypothetical protein
MPMIPSGVLFLSNSCYCASKSTGWGVPVITVGSVAWGTCQIFRKHPKNSTRFLLALSLPCGNVNYFFSGLRLLWQPRRRKCSVNALQWFARPSWLPQGIDEYPTWSSTECDPSLHLSILRPLWSKEGRAGSDLPKTFTWWLGRWNTLKSQCSWEKDCISLNKSVQWPLEVSYLCTNIWRKWHHAISVAATMVPGKRWEQLRENLLRGSMNMKTRNVPCSERIMQDSGTHRKHYIS